MRHTSASHTLYRFPNAYLVSNFVQIIQCHFREPLLPFNCLPSQHRKLYQRTKGFIKKKLNTVEVFCREYATNSRNCVPSSMISFHFPQRQLLGYKMWMEFDISQKLGTQKSRRNSVKSLNSFAILRKELIEWIFSSLIAFHLWQCSGAMCEMCAYKCDCV